MTALLLDTSAYSALMRGHEKIRNALEFADEVAVNPVVLGELRAGFVRGRRRTRNEQELDIFLATPGVVVREIDEDTAVHYATVVRSLRAKGTPIPTNDVWIAATALQHGMHLVTTDEHFERVENLLTERFVSS